MNINNKESFLSFTAHWLDDSFKYNHAVLQMKHFPEIYTADNIKKLFRRNFNVAGHRYDQNSRRCARQLQKCEKALDDSVLNGVPCFIHTLQLTINTALKHDAMVQILVKARRIVTHFNDSNQAQSKLRDLQQELNLSDHQLVQDVTTIWNSSPLIRSQFF
ncbi:hypothetical protein O3G_MSEX012986 [Manduca sexta]|uniref:Uncharacterized protein n=1 Tax=Manduca sexta TaxID=7130 RepID=A0A921ZPZ4_MANSE|nr:hypothetical protein O3G_MSEX012986 [Manduca sexta]